MRQPSHSRFIILALLCAIGGPAATAQTLRTLVHFRGPNGADPLGSLTQGVDGNYYGTTGGARKSPNLVSEVFGVSPAGSLTVLHTLPNFSYGVILASDGNFYGVSSGGGTHRAGTLFRVTPAGAYTVLHNFRGPEGNAPDAGLIEISGALYGVTFGGGAYGGGTVFRSTLDGRIRVLHSFCAQANCADGVSPSAALFLASDGNLYGTTVEGGNRSGTPCPIPAGCGTIFRISIEGTFTLLHTFCSQSGCPDGLNPASGLVEGPDGNLYGTTPQAPAPSGFGTVYRLTFGGNLATIYAFCPTGNACVDGDGPLAGLTLATDGNLYGTTGGGGQYGWGTIFKISTSGQLTSLYSFCADGNRCSDGDNPNTDLLQGTDGNFYGITYGNGNDANRGTAFAFSVGLAPFVSSTTSSGKAGAAVTILGNNLAGSTAVTFNGAPAKFTVNTTGSAITATVPAGASSGLIEVTLASGSVLTSNKAFTVKR